MVYGFDANWYGTVIAEAVLPRFPKALRANIKDPCFAEGYVEQYQAGRVQAVNNIYEAGLSACYLSQLEPFAVKANLVAPILKDEKLFGLLIAHQCAAPREWQQSEIDLLAQLAIQVGFALDHARLLEQVEQAYISVESAFHEQHQHNAVFQRQISELLRDNEAIVETLSSQTVNQMESVTSAYNQIQELANLTGQMLLCIQQTENQGQQFSHAIQDGQEDMYQIADNISAIQVTVMEAAAKVKCLEQPAHKLEQEVTVISQAVAQIKFHAMKIALEATRTGEVSQEFAAEKILALGEQLDTDITKIKSLVGEIHTTDNQVITLIETGQAQAIAGTQTVEAAQKKLNQINAISAQFNALIEELTQIAANQDLTSIAANQSIVEVATIANQTSEQAVAVAQSLAKLTIIVQEDK